MLSKCQQKQPAAKSLQLSFDLKGKAKFYLSQGQNSDCTPSTTGVRGETLEAKVEKFCSSVDSC